MSQKFTSKGTSINSANLPKIFRNIDYNSSYILDYGCGKYIDHIRSEVEKNGSKYLPYDPFNQDEKTNSHSLHIVQKLCDEGKPVDVVCSNVLNVIDDDAVVKEIINYIENIVNSSGGKAYFVVYEGDKIGIGRQTGKDQYQRNSKLCDYLKFFRKARIQKGMIIVEKEA